MAPAYYDRYGHQYPVFMVIRTDTIWLRIVSRIVLIPVIAGVSYEFLSFAGKHDSNW